MRSSGVVDEVSLAGSSVPALHMVDCPCESSHLLRTEEVAAKEVSLNIDGGKVQDCREAPPAACEYRSSGNGCYADDQCHHPGFRMKRNQDQILEMVLSVISLLLTLSAVGGFAFTQLLTTVRSHDQYPNHDQFLEHSLVAFNVLFAASFFCNFLAAFVHFILQSRRECFPYTKFSLIISNTFSFAFLILGYGFVIAFNIQYR
ncbi:hypothetical protein C5167_014715 [Papaver somniferum]|uniref:Uncharacterized protein n=1 Tax=Papaver somniferum TaxID=3469 RepID=A0A4Y7J736_PAPSO|nr:uncharacterized protein LOC113357802 [Papaver somniferum]RZC55860.1 hypothetical protein C5167_014715 [Papaver somniferum]